MKEKSLRSNQNQTNIFGPSAPTCTHLTGSSRWLLSGNMAPKSNVVDGFKMNMNSQRKPLGWNSSYKLESHTSSPAALDSDPPCCCIRHQHNCCSLDVYPLLDRPLSQPRDACDVQVKIPETFSRPGARLAPSTTITMFKVTSTLFLPHSDASHELQQVVFTTSTRVHALTSCHAIGWLASCVNKRLSNST